MKSLLYKSFSTYLLLTMVVLVTGAVVFISGSLYYFFGKKLSREYKRKIQAEKGQVELMLENRLDQVKRRLSELSIDNTIRVTMLLGVNYQLDERLKRYYPAHSGVFFYAKKETERRIHPTNHPDLPRELLEQLLAHPAQGALFTTGDRQRLLWWFEEPVKNRNQTIGKVFALYDLTQDQQLLRTIQRTISGTVAVSNDGNLSSLLPDEQIPSALTLKNLAALKSDRVYWKPDFGYARVKGFDNLYLYVSMADLQAEKLKIALFIGSFTLAVLAVSLLLSIFLGRQMANPLRQMAGKALQISSGHTSQSFADVSGTYLEIRQLSNAFNTMLDNLKKAQEKARFTELMENVDDAVYLLNLEGQILEANTAAYDRLGFTPQNFFHLQLNGLLPQRDADRFLEFMNAWTQRGDSSRITFETHHITAQGQWLPVEINARPITYRGKNVILNVARDISERKAAEQALRENEERYRSVVEYSHDGILIIDNRFRIVYVNPELCRIVGYERGEMKGQDCRRFLDEKSVPLIRDIYRANGDGSDLRPAQSFDILHKGGEKRQVKISVSFITDSQGKQQSVIQILDITDQLKAEQEKRQLQNELFHAQKMQAIGTLAGGIAHDFNNLLMSIQGRVSLMQLHMHAEHAEYEHIQAIAATVKSAANLTKQLLGFARGGKYEVKPTCLNHLLENTVEMFSRTRKEIQIHQDLQQGLWSVSVDRGQIEQVVLNLLLNAWQAMPGGGDLYLKTENRPLDAHFTRYYDVSPGTFVMLTVRDTGVGINQESLDRIFEPFYTTKEMGKGTGLGLASAYGIIKNHKGIIQVESKVGRGSVFKLYLPTSHHQIRHELPETLQLSKGSETVLLVDDEEEVIQVGDLMLQELGYQVLLARSGREAVDLVRELPRQPDMVILDMIMPEMGGRETYDVLSELQPELKVLIASGYSMDEHALQMIDKGCKGFIQKPFDIHMLSHKLREVLEGLAA